MRRFFYLLLALAGLLILGGFLLRGLLQTNAFWRWGGQHLVALAQERLQGEVKVREIKGTPLAGLTFQGVTVTGPQGLAFQAEQVKLRFSLWSFVKLQPVISHLEVSRPRLTLHRDPAGRWEWLGLRPRWGAEAPLPFKSLTLSRVKVQEGEVEFVSPEKRWYGRDLDLDLALTVSNPLGPEPTLEVSWAQLAATTDWGRFGLKARLDVSRSKIDLKSLTVTAEDRPLGSLTGAVTLAGAGPVNLALDLGPLPGAQVRRLLPQWPEAWDLRGKFDLWGSLSDLQIKGEGALKKAPFSLQGKVQPGSREYDLSLSLSQVSPDLLADWNRDWEARLQPLQPLSARVHLKGAGGRLEWGLMCAPFSYQGARVEQLNLALTGDGQGQNLEARLAGNFGRLEGNATGNLLASRSGELKVKADGLQLAPLGPPDLAGSLISGTFTGKFRLPGAPTPPSPWLSGDLEAQGQLAQQPLKELKGRLTWDGVRLEVPRATVRLGPLAADLKGALDGRGVDVHGRGSLAADGSLPWLPTGWRGRLEGEGALKGPWASPQVTVQAQGRGLSGEGMSLDSLSLKAAGAGWPPRSGHLELKGAGWKTLMGTYAQVRLSTQGEGGRWRFDFKGSGPEGPQAEIRGSADFISRPYGLLLDQCRLSLSGVTLASAGPVQVRLSPGWEIAPASFRINEGLLTLQMQAHPGQLSGRLEADSLPAGLLCIQGVPCQGRVKAQATFSGDPLHPVMQGQLTWGPGQWGDFTFRLLTSSFNYREGSFNLSGSLEEKTQGPRLTWDGHIPLRLTLLPPRWDWSEEDLHVRVQGEKANLALLTGLTPEVQAADGSLDIMAEWQGNPRHPILSGQIRWGDGHLVLRQSGARFHLLPGQIRLQGDSLTISEITLESGGTARLSGSLSLVGFQPHQLDLRAHFQDFLGVHRSGSQAKATGTLTLRGPWSAPILSGNLKLSQATFTPGFFRTAIHRDILLVKPPPPPKPSPGPTLVPVNLAFLQNLQMQVGLEAPGGIWLRDKRLNIELSGHVKATKRAGTRVYVAGEAKALKGTYELQGRDFKVERGVIRFPGRPGEEVTVEGQAVHKLGKLTLVLTATGAVDKPQVKLESVPPLPPADLLAYLVFGRAAGSLSREEYVSMGQAAVGIIGGITAQKVQEVLGKDFPLVGNVTLKGGQVEGRQVLGVTKPLTQDLSVSFERKTSPLYRDDTNQVHLEYKVNHFLSVESEMGQRNTGADVFLNLDF